MSPDLTNVGVPFGGTLTFAGGVKYVGGDMHPITTRIPFSPRIPLLLSIGLKTKRCFGSPVRDGPGVMLFPPLGSGDKLEGEWVDGQPGNFAMAAKLTWLWAKNGPSLATRDVGAVGLGGEEVPAKVMGPEIPVAGGAAGMPG